MGTFPQATIPDPGRRPSNSPLNALQTTNQQGAAPRDIGKGNHYVQMRKSSKESLFEDANDDSGIGLDLELSQHQTPMRMADYGGYVVHPASDPSDVVVC